MIRTANNPPWSDKILGSHWAQLEARVGSALMPVARRTVAGLDDVRAQVAKLQAGVDKGMTDAYWLDILRAAKARLAKLEKAKPKGYEEFGCGHYGCVMPTSAPGVVIKVTTDQTEAAFVAAYLSLKPSERPLGIIPYHRLIAIRSASHLKRPVFVLWRAEAQHLGIDGIRHWISTGARDFERDYYARSLKKVMQAVGNCLDAARQIRKRIHKKPDAAEVLRTGVLRMDEAWGWNGPPPARLGRSAAVAWYMSAFRKNAEEMSTEPMGNYVGQALIESFDAGLLLADVHLNNIGMPTGDLLNEIGMTPIVTDPGHAIVLDDRYRGVQVEEL